MRRFCSLALLSTAFLASAFAQKSDQKVLKVTLQSDASTYSIKDNLQLEILRENISSERLIMLRSWAWGGGRTNIWVYDSNGKEVMTSFLPDELPPPPEPWDFVALNRGQFFGSRLNEAAAHFVNKPGVYDLVVEYISYLSEQYAREVVKLPPDALFWSRERGPVLSNRIKITITE
jgi:hypothetical protein